MSLRCRYCLPLLAFLITPAFVGAQELRYKFQTGSKLEYVMEQNQNMKMSAMGTEVDMKFNMTFEFSMAVDSVDTATGAAKVKYKFDRVKLAITGTPMGDMEFDSKSDKEPEGPILAMIAPIFKTLTSSEISLTVSSRGEVSDVKLPQKLKDELANAAGAAGGGFGGGFSEDQLKQIMNNPVFVLPKEPVSNGTTWDSKIEVKTPVGIVKTVNKYTYTGKSGPYEKIDQKMDIKMEPSPDAQIQMSMKTKEASGTILFDNTKGRIQEQTSKTVSEMDLGPIGPMSITQNTVLKVKQ